MKRLAKFLIDNFAKDVLTSAGNQIGEAIGKRIGSKFNPEPKENEKEDAEDTEDKEQKADDRGGKPEEDPGPTASWTRRLLTD